VRESSRTALSAMSVLAVVFMSMSLFDEIGGPQPITHASARQEFRCVVEELLIDDRFDAVVLEEGDDAGAAIPDAVARAPDFVGVDLAAGG